MIVESTQIDFDTEVGGECAPDLYRAQRTAERLDGFAAIDEAAIAQFREQGFLAIEHAFSSAEVASAIDGVLALIDGTVAGFRGIQFEKNTRALVEHMPPEQKQDAVRKLSKFVEYEQRLAALATHPHLAALLTRLIGEPPELFQDQALLKPPLIGREKPWHQDNAYFNLPPETLVIGVWIALDEATPENGCMFVIPGTHHAGPTVHFRRRDWQICDTDVAVDQELCVPLQPGGALIFHGLLHHGTPPSRSASRRRALQYHYKPASVAPIAPDERLAVFGGEGRGATC